MAKKKLNIDDYKTYKSIQIKRGDSIWKIARQELPAHLRTDGNINALTQQILKINGISAQFARTILPGRKLIVPDIGGEVEAASGDVRYTIKKGDTLRRLVSYFYQRKKGERLSAIADKVRHHSLNASHELPQNMNEELPEGLVVVLPGIDPRVGEMVEVPYNFYRPELWLRRWVSIMRSLKSTLMLFREAIVDISDLTEQELDEIAHSIIQANASQSHAGMVNGDDWPRSRNGIVQLMLDDLSQKIFEPVAEEYTLDELSALQKQVNDLYDESNQLEDSKWEKTTELHNLQEEINQANQELVNLQNAISQAKAELKIETDEPAVSDWLSGLRKRITGLFGSDTTEDLLDEEIPIADGGYAPDQDQVEVFDPVEEQPYTMAVNPWVDDGLLDPEFELKQLLNLYVLTWNLLIFVDEELGPNIASSLPGRWQAKHYRKHPPINLVGEAMRRASIDIEIVQRAIVQRKRELDYSVHRLTRQGESLLIMDKLTKMALAPFQHLLSGSPEQINPITYFSEKTHIRRVPYAPDTLLVGIAYAFASYHQDDLAAYSYLLNDVPDADQNRFWPSYEVMAIPHEAGHFFYHLAIDPKTGKSMAELTADRARTDKFGRWYEEIFADVYGCFISGPLTAMGLQGLLAGSSVRDMSLDDGEHPVPIFRPFIISEILRELSKLDEERYDYHKAPDALDDNWEKILRLRGHSASGETDLMQTVFQFAQAEGDHRDHFDEARQRVAPSIQEKIVIETTIDEVLAEVRPIIATFV
ncbi:MAG: LysM peptidoglycan-binding domain-containing protein, partial [Chloroflexota bacterium]